MNWKKNLIFSGFLLVGLIVGLFLWGVQNPKEFIFNYSPTGHLVAQLNNHPAPEQNPPVNLLFLGVAGDGSRGALLTDTIFVIHINPHNKKVALISIPRDLWVQIPQKLNYSKINGLYELENPHKRFFQARSYNLIKKKVEQILDLKINYVIIFDLIGVEKLIDSVGGIDIYLEKDVVDPNLVNPHNPHQIFHLPAGWQHLDGKTAAKFIRTRYNPDGDFYRIKHQQQVIATLKDKISRLSTSWSLQDWLKLWKDLSGHFISDLKLNDALQIFRVLKSIPSDRIIYLSITNRKPDKLLITTSVKMIGATGEIKDVYVLIPRAGLENYSSIQAYIHSHITSSNND